MAVQQSLRRIGITQLGECMRLPRDGLARRIGTASLREIDEALGRRPEVRPAYREDCRFYAEYELPAETCETGGILDALAVLFGRLRTQLVSRQAGARIIWAHLKHGMTPPTMLRIGLLRPSIDAAHLQELAAIHLSAVRVPSPVTAIVLEADVADLASAAGGDLLGSRSDVAGRIAGLVERLRVRLGLHAVHGIWPGEEHRPERAWHAVAEFGSNRLVAGETGQGPQRPLWIAERPVLLAERAGRPCFHGPLVLERGPERIETGWWDGEDVQRDYYMGRNPRGVAVWIFRDRRSARWYLHGLFG
jgi:protein ImuB